MKAHLSVLLETSKQGIATPSAHRAVLLLPPGFSSFWLPPGSSSSFWLPPVLLLLLLLLLLVLPHIVQGTVKITQERKGDTSTLMEVTSGSYFGEVGDNL